MNPMVIPLASSSSLFQGKKKKSKPVTRRKEAFEALKAKDAADRQAKEEKRVRNKVFLPNSVFCLFTVRRNTIEGEWLMLSPHWT